MSAPNTPNMPGRPPARTPATSPEPRMPRRRPTERAKAVVMGVLLIGIAVLGPAVTYAGVSVVWPGSQKTVDIDTTPPITFSQGGDYTQAESIGFASSFSTSDNAAAFTITLSGLSGGTVTIDEYANASVASTVDTWKMEISDDLSGTLTAPTLLKLRLWTGSTAPTADGDAQVCGVLDLKAATSTETSTTCSDDAEVQLVYTLPSSSSGSSSVTIRPSSIVFV